MSELKKIDGINVLFIDDDKNLSQKLMEFDKEKIGLVVVGHGESGLIELLKGRTLTDYIKSETPKTEAKPLSEIIKDADAIPIRALPQFEEPFFPTVQKPHLQKKWYEGKRKRKK